MRPHETDEITRGMAVYLATYTNTLLVFMGNRSHLNAFLCMHIYILVK